MISIFTKNNSNRLKYTVDFIFKEIAQIPYQISTDVSSLTDHVINYTDEELQIKSYQISPSGLLHAKAQVKPNVDSNLPYFCLFQKDYGNHPFDVFSAIFYLISRMEEYNSSQVDIHGRFIASQSILVKENQHFEPVVDQWVINLIDQLNLQFNSNYKISRQFNQYCTIDVDNAYAFKYKGFIRTAAGTIKDSILNQSKFKQRFNLYKGTANDPYDTYEYLRRFGQKNKLDLIYFLLLGDYAKYDKNIPFNHPKMISLVSELKKTAIVGIHPSYASGKNHKKLGEEKKRLENIVGESVLHSRFHFLKFRMPMSYQHLLSFGISHDYSMGYADQIGFRAGTCTPFYFFDLENEIQTKLKIHPFAYMDGVLKDQLQLNTEKAVSIIQTLRNNIKDVNGTFTSIWHNESISNLDRWNGWREVFEESWSS